MLTHKRPFSIQLTVIVLAVGLVMVGLQPQAVRATDTPAISVAPIWRPGTQLTSIFTGSPDVRYVDAQVYITTSVEFWAAEFTCTVSPSVLQSYTPNGISGDPGNVPMVTWGPNWGGSQSAYVDQPFNATTGAMTIAASRYNGYGPMGANDFTESFLAATIRYQVKAAAGTSPFTCTSSFLDRNGVSVLTATYVAPVALKVIAGYVLKGNVSYQGRTAKSGITVRCQTPPAPFQTATYDTTTDSSGNFTITSRLQGAYECIYGWNGPNFTYLNQVTEFTVSGLSYTFMPVTLPGGNLEFGLNPIAIDGADIAVVTANYGRTAATAGTGDVNGDGKTDKADLAIVAGNLNEYAGDFAFHVLYGLARSNGASGPDNRIWLGQVKPLYWNNMSQPVIGQAVPGTNRDFWPALSPDGSQIVFVRLVGSRHVLFVMPVGGTTATQITPTSGAIGGWDEAFAPSWSPDGTKIAFVCSYPGGWQVNKGNLCVVDPSGKNLELIVQYGSSTIYPPAWLNNHTLLFGANSASISACRNTICLYDFSTEALSALDAHIVSAADMPVVRGSDLFYRTTGAPCTGHCIVLAEIPGTGSLSAIGTTTYPMHVFAQWNNGGTPAMVDSNVDYYTASPASRPLQSRMLMWYETGSSSGYWYGFTRYSEFSPFWEGGTASYHIIYDNLGNPSWDLNPADPTNLWGEHNTFDWEP